MSYGGESTCIFYVPKLLRGKLLEVSGKMTTVSSEWSLGLLHGSREGCWNSGASWCVQVLPRGPAARLDYKPPLGEGMGGQMQALSRRVRK